MRIRVEPSMYMSVLLETRRRRLLLTLRLVMIYYEEALSTVPLCLGSSMSASLLVLCIACTLRARSGESEEETLWSWNHSASPTRWHRAKGFTGQRKYQRMVLVVNSLPLDIC